MKSKLPKVRCEIEGCNITNPKILEYHHIIEQTKVETSNDPWNLAILCPVHHALLHTGELQIIGPYPFTNDVGRILIYQLNGKYNVEGITKPYVTPKVKGLKIRKENE